MAKKSTKKAAKKAAGTTAARKLAAAKHMPISKAKAIVAAAPIHTPGGALAIGIQLMHSELYPSALNPRKELGDKASLQALSDSIVAEGVLQSLLVREGHKHGTYEIICGARRHAAVGLAIKAGKLPKTFTLPCRKRVCTDAELVELAGTENMGRHDMHPLEEADVIAAMRKYHKDDAEIARRLGIPERTFYRRAALLRLADPVRDAVKAGKVSLQQASAFTLGTPAAQTEHLKRMLEGGGGSFYSDVVQIRRSMTEKRIPVSRACFPIAQYDGEILQDPETGARYFTSAKLFNELQDAAIKLRVQGLKKEFGWVKEISEFDAYLYAKAKKGDRSTGAVYFTKTDGTFQVVAPVLKPADSEKAEAADRQAEDAADEKADKAAADLFAKVTETVLDNQAAGLALLVLDWLDQNCYGLDPAEIKLLGPIVGALLGCKGTDDLEAKLRDVTDLEKAKIYRVLMDLEEGEVLDILLKLAARGLANNISGHGRGLDPVGMAVMQIELPLGGDKKAAA